jgi:organic hydroperoxide reductase OsmC/OhrA
MLAAAVANCLCASLLFCARRVRVEPGRIRAEITTGYTRNENGRLRIGGMRVRLDPGFAPQDAARAGRCVRLFEDFCTVSQSVRQGIPIAVEVAGFPSLAPSMSGPAS